MVSKERFCTRVKDLCCVKLVNDHKVIALFKRSLGTNYSVQQRLLIFFVQILGVFCSTAIFFDAEADDTVT